jgi:GTP pyrophosphokinase
MAEHVLEDRTLTQTVICPEASFLFDSLQREFRATLPDGNAERFSQAYELARLAHEGQYREDGRPYIMHPLEVAEICLSLKMEEDSIIAALLHDTVEETQMRQDAPIRVSVGYIRSMFGPVVAEMVDSLTKIRHLNLFARFIGQEQAKSTPGLHARNLQKLFIAMARDPRVMIIKLSDRLHNLRTLAVCSCEKQERICRETDDFFIPLARRLGLGRLQAEMDDWTFYYLYPGEYASLRERVDKEVLKETAALDGMITDIRSHLAQHGIYPKGVFGRRKHLASIWRKMKTKGVPLDQVYDLLAIRIILPDEDHEALSCYRVLGLVHSRYKPIFERFRDFISAPKNNGYQTLHTTVIGPKGKLTEVQIRNETMNRNAEYGIAAHWRYEETKMPFERDLSWLDFIRDLREERMDPEAFVESTKRALLQDQVIVFSPKREMASLPRGSTPIDYAYFVHTDLGHSCRGARVNGRPVPLDYELANGDLVEIIPSGEANPAPDPEWLNVAKSPRALLKIRRWLKTQPQSKRMEIGRNMLREHVEREGLYPLNLLSNDKLLRVLKMLKIRRIDDIYNKIASGEVSLRYVISLLKQLHIETVKEEPDRLPSIRLKTPGRPVVRGMEVGVASATGKLLVQKVELAECCSPIPGDDIVGLPGRERGMIEVHQESCATVKAAHDVKVTQLVWDRNVAESLHYSVGLEVEALNRVGLLFEILGILSRFAINLAGGNFNVPVTSSFEERFVQMRLIIEVKDVGQLNQVVNEIAHIEDVIRVKRVVKTQE